MLQKLVQFSLFFSCIIFGWILGFIKLSFFKNNYTYLIGILVCFGMIFIVYTCIHFLKLNSLETLQKSINLNKRGTQLLKFSKQKYLLSFIFISLLLFYLTNYLGKRTTSNELNYERVKLSELQFSINLENQRNKISLLYNLISQLDSTKLKYQDFATTIEKMNRIVSLSSTMKIHAMWEIENNKYSILNSDRKLLLLALLKTTLDSNIVHKIFSNISFYGIDLRNVEFNNFDLRGINLKNANLENAKLQGINLDYADLRGANMFGANLNKASPIGTNLTSANLTKANLNEANLQMAKVDSADFSDATMQNSNLKYTSFMYSTLCNADLIESDLNYSVLISTNLSNTNLSKTLLTNADIYRTNMGNSIFNYAVVDANWKKRLLKKDNKNVNKLMEKYILHCDSITIQDSFIYQLIPKKL